MTASSRPVPCHTSDPVSVSRTVARVEVGPISSTSATTEPARSVSKLMGAEASTGVRHCSEPSAGSIRATVTWSPEAARSATSIASSATRWTPSSPRRTGMRQALLGSGSGRGNERVPAPAGVPGFDVGGPVRRGGGAVRFGAPVVGRAGARARTRRAITMARGRVQVRMVALTVPSRREVPRSGDQGRVTVRRGAKLDGCPGLRSPPPTEEVGPVRRRWRTCSMR